MPAFLCWWVPVLSTSSYGSFVVQLLMQPVCALCVWKKMVVVCRQGSSDKDEIASLVRNLGSLFHVVGGWTTTVFSHLGCAGALENGLLSCTPCIEQTGHITLYNIQSHSPRKRATPT
ncbi:hypothetical protein ACSBR1_033936 [Camellia fascicularis]